MRVSLHADPAALREAENWSDAGRTPFQSPAWLSLWYRSFDKPDLRPLIARIETADGAPVGLAPLIRRRRYGLTSVEFADRGVTDYNALLAAPRADEVSPHDALRALIRAVRPFARLRLAKMPAPGDAQGGLSIAPGAPRVRPDPLTAFTLSTRGGVAGLEAGWGAKRRKDLRRRMRILHEASGGAGEGGGLRFGFAEGAVERRAVLDLVRRSQARRFSTRADYVLERPAYAAFYEALAGDAHRAFARLPALWFGETPIAGALCLSAYGRCVVIRLGASDDPVVERAGGGVCLIAELARHTAREGLSELDLSIGANALKTRFGCTPHALHRIETYANGFVTPPPPKRDFDEQG